MWIKSGIGITLFLLSNIVVAEESYNNSFYQAVLDKQASHHRVNDVKTTTPPPLMPRAKYTNSLFDAVLAKQGLNKNIVITKSTDINTEQYDPQEVNNSLFRAALSKHYQDTH